MKKKKRNQSKQDQLVVCEFCNQSIKKKVKPYHLEHGCPQAMQCVFCGAIIGRSADSVHVFQDYREHLSDTCAWLQVRENRLLVLRKWNMCPICIRKIDGRTAHVDDTCDFCTPLLSPLAKIAEAQIRAKAAKWKHQQEYFKDRLENVPEISSSEARGEGQHWATLKKRRK